MAHHELTPLSLEDGTTPARKNHHIIVRRETPNSPWYVQKKDILGHQIGHYTQAQQEAALNLAVNRSMGNSAEYEAGFLTNGQQIPRKAESDEEPYVVIDGIPMVMYTHTAEEAEQPVVDFSSSKIAE